MSRFFIEYILYLIHLFNMKIKKIRLGHDGTKFGAGWFVEDVRIYNKSRDETSSFAVHRWFDKKEDDKKIERDLEPASVVKGNVLGEYQNKIRYKIMHIFTVVFKSHSQQLSHNYIT